MPRHLFRHLRRSRALLVLAVFAWLALASVGLAMPRAQDSCCPPTMAMGAMSMSHAMPDHAPAHASTSLYDSCCAHAPASVPAAAMPHVSPMQADASPMNVRHVTAPQPVYEPPLRPPVA